MARRLGKRMANTSFLGRLQYKGKDISGQYRFTDTWIKKAGRWQCVATAGTKITKK